ncbi:uncharacterized membrane protein YidH (DUF202 family) [Nocardioides albertanoniae]|uniref:Uncharacterized membrane protein YidH (DUF202 family) n=1 Tax=Nocardioides albertanoniae TaxID=1175486 RepID=A0A543ADJ2_9ACTN|nr:DUF202 domain-containing protein [Nocardioides albertanoniae]TQL70655.1 uncharacterized membrane protein YidH (DUF202 family) [Nocardioides albertanoniae]
MRPTPGVQAERTLLAWQRTSLSIAAGGALLLHYTVERFATAGVVAGALALSASVGCYLASRRRYGAAHRDTGGNGRVQDAGLPCALMSLAVIVLAAAVFCLCLVRATEVLG